MPVSYLGANYQQLKLVLKLYKWWPILKSKIQMFAFEFIFILWEEVPEGTTSFFFKTLLQLFHQLVNWVWTLNLNFSFPYNLLYSNQVFVDKLSVHYLLISISHTSAYRYNMNLQTSTKYRIWDPRFQAHQSIDPQGHFEPVRQSF